MSEFNKNFIIRINNLKDSIVFTSVIINGLYQKITWEFIKTRLNHDKSVITDSDIIILSLVVELLSISYY